MPYTNRSTRSLKITKRRADNNIPPTTIANAFQRPNFERTLRIRRACADAVNVKGFEIPKYLRNSIVRPRRDNYGIREENKRWKEFLKDVFKDVWEAAVERMYRKREEREDDGDSEGEEWLMAERMKLEEYRNLRG